MLELLLNNVTFAVAIILFLGLVTLLIIKRKQLSKAQKRTIYILCAIFVVYFVFVGVLTFAFENTHPYGGPKPVF